MEKKIVLLSIPGLRHCDLERMPATLARLKAVNGVEPITGRLRHSFPSVTWPAQANMLTGKLSNEHGIVANGFYWRNENRVEMWTAWNKVIERPQIWDILHSNHPKKTSAAWFPMLSKGCGADYVCMPAPIHKPDGSEDLWCYTKPQEHYGELLAQFGHFPLQHFWGPLANIKSTNWIAESFAATAKKYLPDFSYVYLPHLDYAAQKFGPDSAQAGQAVIELDAVVAQLIESTSAHYAPNPIGWMLVSEYVIQAVDHVVYPNRELRKANLLSLTTDDDNRETIAFAETPTWALVDHQFSHVFVRDAAPNLIADIHRHFEGLPGIASVLSGSARDELGMAHERSGDVILISEPNSWQAYYWWLDDACAPAFSRTVDIHRKPGYDPVELFFDPATRSIPLDATLIKGSHGVITSETASEAVWIASGCLATAPQQIKDTDICDFVLAEFQ